MTLFPDVQKKAQAEIDAITVVPLSSVFDILTAYNARFMLNNPQTCQSLAISLFLANNGKKPKTEPRTICFGFGRRICPGMHNSQKRR
ncbi:hypothetical protein EV702DRAFT_1203259 [Suillus placidus]|uniref:Cytochrome P450 n=1 Tax=Suillus placidus TaxID=48579 RepID=A0A9P6ZJT4_9AGAM|nr:hypothetical protein EV702DRAFT_1203259 [Suillus placidus]